MATAADRTEKRANLKRPIYLDNQATTPLDPRVLAAMMPYLEYEFGNPHSITHEYGWIADDAVETARGKIAQLIGARRGEIVLTSGATESNNLAIKGVMGALTAPKNHLITVATEHKCVLESARAVEAQRARVTYLPVGPTGLVDLEQLRDAIGPDTGLVSVMTVNNEIGVIQPIAEIGAICRERGVLFHTDAAQALGKIELDVRAMAVDLMSLTSHKIYGPKGIGALYVRARPPVALRPLLSGGGQERGLRPGTLAPHLVVGFGAAAEIAGREMAEEAPRIAAQRDRLWRGIAEALDDVCRNGDAEHAVAGNLNVMFGGVAGDQLLLGLKELAVSNGSACTSASIEPSHVLRALGLDDDRIEASIRFGIGRFTTDAEIGYAVKAVVREVRKLRSKASST